MHREIVRDSIPQLIITNWFMNDSEHKNTNYQDNVENWTIQRCNDYLAKYPKGFKADVVKKRLDELIPIVTNSPIEKTHHTSQSQTNNKQARKKDIVQEDTSTTSKKYDGWDILGKVILSILAIGLAFGLGWVIVEIFDTSYSVNRFIFICCVALSAGLLKEIWD